MHTPRGPMCFPERLSSLPPASSEQVRTRVSDLDTSQGRVGPSEQSALPRSLTSPAGRGAPRHAPWAPIGRALSEPSHF